MSRFGWVGRLQARVRQNRVMSRVGWTAGAVGAAAVGAIGVIVFPAALAMGLVLGVLVAFAVMSTHIAGPGAGTAGRTGILAGAVTVATGLVLAGLVVLLGGVAAIVVPMLLVGAAGWAWRRRRTGRAAAAPASAAPLPGTAVWVARQRAALLALRPDAMSTRQLCAAWCRTYWVMQDLPPGSTHLQFVTIRAGLLDELERRDPAGFQRWLDTGARAGSDPGRHLTAGA